MLPSIPDASLAAGVVFIPQADAQGQVRGWPRHEALPEDLAQSVQAATRTKVVNSTTTAEAKSATQGEAAARAKAAKPKATSRAKVAEARAVAQAEGDESSAELSELPYAAWQ